MKRPRSLRFSVAALLAAVLVTAVPAQTDQPHRRLYDQILHGTAWVIVSRGRGEAQQLQRTFSVPSIPDKLHSYCL